MELPIPSPNDQTHTAGALADASVNCTVRGAVPEVGLAEKAATGATAVAAVVATVVGEVVATVVTTVAGTVVAAAVAVVVAAAVAVTVGDAVTVGVTVTVGVAVAVVAGAVGVAVTVVLSAAAGMIRMPGIMMEKQKARKKVPVFISFTSGDMPVSHWPAGFLPLVAL